MATASTPTWLNQVFYPFRPHYIEVDGGKMHYVDEGEGEVILFVHGTPAWSFLYREQIKHLRQNYRCIAVDHIGFGLSDKPADFEGTPQAHVRNLAQLIEKLQLSNITLVVHDFGGPIGLGAALENPEKVRQLVILNTWLWATKHEKEVQKIDGILKSLLGRFLYLSLNFSPKVLMKKSFFNRNMLPKAVHQHYIKVFPNRQARLGLYKIGLSLAGASHWYEAQHNKLHALENKPVLIVWGMKDPFIRPAYLEKWKHIFPQAEVVTTESGHFLQEEVPQEVTAAIEKLMKEC